MPFPAQLQSMYLWYRKKSLCFSSTEKKDIQEKYEFTMSAHNPTPQRSMTWAQYKDVAEFFTRPKGASAAGKPLDWSLFGTVLPSQEPYCALVLNSIIFFAPLAEGL